VEGLAVDQFDDNLSSADGLALEQFDQAGDGLQTSPSKKRSDRSVQVAEFSGEFFDADNDIPTPDRAEEGAPGSPMSPKVGPFPSTRSVGSKDPQKANRREKRSSTDNEREKKKTEMERKNYNSTRTPVSGVLRSLQKSASSFAEKRKANTMDNLSKALSTFGVSDWDWEELQGVKMPGQHILVETLSLTDAKTRVKALQAQGCDGFCYQPTGETDGLFQIHFGVRGTRELVTDSAWRTVVVARRLKKLASNHEAI
jgi:hypothetical protein